MLQLLQPQHLIQVFGLIGVTVIIFAESGLFFGFFLPGDSLLFTAGLFAAQGYMNIFALCILAAAAAILGDSAGYAFGKKVGPSLFSREDSFFFHKKHAARAKEFFDRYGKKTIILARFAPVVRTFAPIVAGVGDMPYSTFISYNIIGGAGWALLLTLLGYFLGIVFPQIQHYLDYVILAIIVVSFMPIVVEWLRERRKRTVV